jgi:hypothetical protein
MFAKKKSNAHEILKNNYTTASEKNLSTKPFIIELVKPLFVEIENKDKTKTKKEIKKKTIFHKIVNNNYFVWFMTVLTITALFANDIQMAWLNAHSDEAFDIIQCFLFLCFLLEIIFTFFAKKNYLNSFFFWLDVISTISLIQDISFIFSIFLEIAYK